MSKLRKNKNQGFSLVEMLVSVSILVLILVQMTAVINQSSGAIGIAKSRVTIEQVAFDVFTRMQRDFDGLIQTAGTHLLIQKNPGNDQFGFYTSSVRWVGDRHMCWVLYCLEKGFFQRGLLGLDYGSTDKSSSKNNILRSFYLSNTQDELSYPTVEEQDFDQVSGQIIRFETWSMDWNGKSIEFKAEPPKQTNGSIDFERFRGVLIGIVVVDPVKSSHMTLTMKESLAGNFPDAISQEDPVEPWHQVLQNRQALAQASNVPHELIKEISVYQHLFWFKNGDSK